MEAPFDYQTKGAEFLASKTHALLADEMGLGKTRQAILGLDRVRAKHILIICPSVARINWLREFEMWSETERSYHVMTKLTDTPPYQGVVICSFDYATHNYAELTRWQAGEIGKKRWDCVIVDEAHYLKSHTAKRAKAIMGVNGVVRATDRMWLLTGTPAPNNPSELWIILFTFGVTKLSYDGFLREFCIVRPTSFGLKVVSANSANIPKLRQLLSSVMLRRLKKDVMVELPPISYGHVNVEPGFVDVEILPSFTQYFLPTDRRDELRLEIARQAELLSAVYDNMKPNQEDRLSGLAAIASSVSTLRRYIGLQKCQAAIELIKSELEANAYKKIVIFAIHTDVIETMRMGLKQFDVVVLFGGTAPEKRQKNIDRFQKNPKCRVFIGNVHAAGTAITLTAAHNVTFIEQDWVPGVNAQAVMRCHRIGQTEHVKVRFIVLDGTLDAKIGYVLKQKTRDLTHIFD